MSRDLKLSLIFLTTSLAGRATQLQREMLKIRDNPNLIEIKNSFEQISYLCQEALETIALHNGEITPGEHQNIAPAERRPEA